MTDGNPLSGIYSAVTRKSESGTILDSLQNITVGEALKIYTTDAAYSSFEENTLGVIKPGANADMIVLSEDPLTIDPEGLKDIRVRATFLNGRQVYST